MSCYHPTIGYRSRTGPTSTGWPLVFNKRDGYSHLEVTVPCGQCIGCRLEKARQWAVRIMHEVSISPDAKYLTLTYDDEHLGDNELNKRDIILFIKKLRKQKSKQNIKIRYFQCGEYGEDTGRRHHHMVVWINPDPKASAAGGQGGRGATPPSICQDLSYYKKLDNGYVLYRSPSLGELWGKGFVNVGNVTFESANYVAKYVAKDMQRRWNKQNPQYSTMSRNPGIGALWLKEFMADVKAIDGVIVNGKVCRSSRYYDGKIALVDKAYMEGRKEARKQKIVLSEQTYERMETKRQVTWLNLKKFKRSGQYE